MLRYICSTGVRLLRSQIPSRGMSVETLKDVEKEKKLKLVELELDVNKKYFLNSHE
jgi:hypothetical protein